MTKDDVKFQQMADNFECDAEFSCWNDKKLAFIKNDILDGKEMWLICTADGRKIAATDDREFAFVMAKQNDLNPTSVH